MKKPARPCSIIGCIAVAADKHHIGGASSPMIWICKECHGRIHGLRWNAEHGELVRAGIARARAEGRVGGNPRVRDPAFHQAQALARREQHRQRVLAGKDAWLPIVLELRPRTRWADVARIVSQKTGEVWTAERLRRTVKSLIEAGLVEASVSSRARPEYGPQTRDHLVQLIRALSPGRSYAQVATELERLGERTPKGGTRWHPSSVIHLLPVEERPPGIANQKSQKPLYVKSRRVSTKTPDSLNGHMTRIALFDFP